MVQSEKPREPLVILSETLVILSEPRPRFLARLPGEVRPKGADPAVGVQPPLELSDLVLRFEQLFALELVLAHPVVTRLLYLRGIRFELSDLVLRFEKRDVVLQ